MKASLILAKASALLKEKGRSDITLTCSMKCCQRPSFYSPGVKHSVFSAIYFYSVPLDQKSFDKTDTYARDDLVYNIVHAETHFKQGHMFADKITEVCRDGARCRNFRLIYSNSVRYSQYYYNTIFLLGAGANLCQSKDALVIIDKTRIWLDNIGA